MKRKIIFSIFAIVLFYNYNINAATITVTSIADARAGSLRQAVLDAKDGDTINFASDVNYIVLNGTQIEINKNITIDGGSDTTKKVTIDANEKSRIFYVDSNLTFNINNLILTKGMVSDAGGAVYLVYSEEFTATNCNFNQNSAAYWGGAVSFDIYTTMKTFTATNCTFSQNIANECNGGAVHLFTSPTTASMTFIATNCTFSQNIANRSGGAVYMGWWGLFNSINCIFSQNIANKSGGAVFISTHSFPPFLYHCTFDNNKAEYGNAIFKDEDLHTYNCIYTGDTTQIFSTYGYIYGDNLIEGIDGIAREKVFGDNEFDSTLGYIMPLKYAKSATKLTSSSIEVPDEWFKITADDIIYLLIKDQAGKTRPTTGFVTYGAIEYRELLNLTINATEGGTTNPKGTTQKDTGEVVIITATTTDSCYYFSHWEDKYGKAISEDSVCEITTQQDTILTAIFEKKPFIITISANPSYMGMVTGTASGLYYCGDERTLIAKPSDTLYRFVNWTAGGQSGTNDTISTNDTLIITLQSDTNIRANFELDVSILENDIYDISIVPNPTENDFNIIFDNTESQNISIELLDISGRNILDIYSDFASAEQHIYKVDKKLASGTYFIKFMLGGNIAVRKVIVK